MGWLQFWRKLYSLETLDTRFVIPSNTPPGVTATGFELNHTRPEASEQQNATTSSSGPPRSELAPNTRPSLWNTTEFITLYVTKKGIHPGAHIALDFLISGGLILVGLADVLSQRSLEIGAGSLTLTAACVRVS